MRKAEMVKPCVSCGAPVPEVQPYPYHGHTETCELVQEFLRRDTERSEHTEEEHLRHELFLLAATLRETLNIMEAWRPEVCRTNDWFRSAREKCERALRGEV